MERFDTIAGLKRLPGDWFLISRVGAFGKPDLHYSFHMLSAVNRSLLDSLHIGKVIVLGHSMGGMLAIRFTLLYPQLVEKLVLENPIGLEDYKTFVPYQSLDQLYKKEKSASYASYKKYQQTIILSGNRIMNNM